MTNSSSQVRWGILGTANIARAAFLPGLRQAGGVAAAVAGRDAARTEQYASDNGVERAVTGYQNLLKLVSDAHLQGFYYKPLTDLDTLAKHADGLIGFTGCLASLVPYHLMNDRYD